MRVCVHIHGCRYLLVSIFVCLLIIKYTSVYQCVITKMYVGKFMYT